MACFAAGVAWWNGKDIFSSGLVQIARVVLFQMLVIPLHELGHALAMKVFDCRDIRIVLGLGRPLFSFRALGFQWSVQPLPIIGFAVSDFTRLHRFKQLLIVVAGPAVNFAIIALIHKFHAPHPYRIDPLESADAIDCLLWANWVILVINLIPYQIPGIGPNDGLATLRLLLGESFMPDPARPSRVTRYTNKAFRVIGIFFLLLCIAGFVCVDFVVIQGLRTLGSMLLYGLAAFLIALTLVLSWLTFRAIKETFEK